LRTDEALLRAALAAAVITAAGHLIRRQRALAAGSVGLATRRLAAGALAARALAAEVRTLAHGRAGAGLAVSSADRLAALAGGLLALLSEFALLTLLTLLARRLLLASLTLGLVKLFVITFFSHGAFTPHMTPLL
jgi:hypothetical protein